VYGTKLHALIKLWNSYHSNNTSKNCSIKIAVALEYFNMGVWSAVNFISTWQI